tara:strand:- start:168 stop:1094 length:927 start_codon:yes stop_codon:yes gene_type:complete
MKKIFYIILINFIFFTFIQESKAKENKILFKINNQIVTSVDILDEINYLGTINEEYKKLDKENAIKIAKKSLVREKIKEIELSKIYKEIKIDNEYLNQFSINYFKRLGIRNISDFENFFLQQNVNPNKVRKKITIEILWNQFIYKKYNENIKINKDSIKKELLNNTKQKEFLLSEILFTLSNDEELAKKFSIIKKEIEKNSFSKAALKHSVSNSRNEGGKLSWVKESVLSGKIKKNLSKLNVGDYTNPIIIPGGFLILKLEDKRETQRKINLENEMKFIINEKRNEQLNQLSNIYFSKIKKNIIINEL